MGTTNYFASESDPRNTSQNTFKIDYKVNDNNTLSVRGTIYEYHEIQPFRGTFPLVQLASNRPNYTSVASLTTTLSPTLVNEAAVTASEDRDWNNPSENGRFMSAASTGSTIRIFSPAPRTCRISAQRPGQLLDRRLRAVSFLFRRPHFHVFGHGHQGEGEPHHQVRSFYRALR